MELPGGSKVSGVYDKLANICTSFSNLSRNFMAIYTAYRKPVLVYAAPIWNPDLVKHKMAEKTHFATRLVL